MNTDAVCGQAVCGLTYAGTWWVYPPLPGLALVSIEPIESGYVVIAVPVAGLGLGGLAPTKLGLSQILEVPIGALGLGGLEAPVEIRLQRLSVGVAGLGLDGLTVVFVGQEWVHPSACDEIDLFPEDCDEIVLTPAGCD